MPSPKYDKLKRKMDDRRPVIAVYNNDNRRRKLCPHVLGYKKDENEREETVLCFQLAGPEPSKGWRCFRVEALTIADDDINPIEWETPPNYDPRWQNVMKKPKHHV